MNNYTINLTKPTTGILVLFLAILSFSCAESDDMTTVINPDGSCYREFVESVDSAFMSGDTTEKSNPFPVKIDSTCKIAWKIGNDKLRTDFPISKTLYDSIIGSIPPNIDSITKKVSLSATNGIFFIRIPPNIDSITKKETKVSNPFTVVLRKEYKSVEEMGENFGFKPSNEWSSMKVKYSLNKKFRYQVW